MKIKIIVLAVVAVVAMTDSSQANTISQWIFELNPLANINNTAAISGIAADIGNGTASGMHASSATDWSTPRATAPTTLQVLILEQ